MTWRSRAVLIGAITVAALPLLFSVTYIIWGLTHFDETIDKDTQFTIVNDFSSDITVTLCGDTTCGSLISPEETQHPGQGLDWQASNQRDPTTILIVHDGARMCLTVSYSIAVNRPAQRFLATEAHAC